MRGALLLLRSRLWSFRNSQLLARAKDRKIRVLLFGSIGLLFWGGIFAIFYRVLVYFQSVEDFGDILAFKLLSMVVMTFFALLVFSGIITSLSKLYMSRDLILVHSLPVRVEQVFLARWLESTIDSSWMVVVYSLPIFLSYGIVFQGGLPYYLTAVLAIIPLCLIASALSATVVVVVAVLLPAGRIRTVFVFLGVMLVLILVVALRLMRPEQLVNPEDFASLLLYFKSMETPGSPLLPTTWVIDAVRASLRGALPEALFDLSLAWSGAVSLIYAMTWMAGAVYFTGFSRSQTTPERLFSPARGKARRIGWLRVLPGPVRAFWLKEVRSFFRDPTQWPQVFLIMALIAVYLYNFSVLPLEKSPIKTVYLQNLFAFLNMGLASFVLTAIAARFVYPAVSIEGDAFWIVQAAPIPIRTFLWIKFFVYYLPLLLLAEVLIVVSNLLLQVTPFMMVLSSLTVFCMVPGIVAMGIGLGAAYPDFKSENPAQSVTSFGGLLFMVFCAAFIAAVITLEAGPVYAVFMAGLRGTGLSVLQGAWLAGSFLLVLLLCILAVVLPMRIGERRLLNPP